MLSAKGHLVSQHYLQPGIFSRPCFVACRRLRGDSHLIYRWNNGGILRKSKAFFALRPLKGAFHLNYFGEELGYCYVTTFEGFYSSDLEEVFWANIEEEQASVALQYLRCPFHLIYLREKQCFCCDSSS